MAGGKFELHDDFRGHRMAIKLGRLEFPSPGSLSSLIA
jgi:hypothetical protein